MARGRTSGTGTWGTYDESYDYNPIGNLTNKGGVLYTYPSPGSAHPHAVTSTSNGGSFSYDPNPTSLRSGDDAAT